MTYPARTAREARGLSSADAARKLGITPGHLRGLESGRARWPYLTALTAARLYGVDVMVFVRPPTGAPTQPKRRPGRRSNGRAARPAAQETASPVGGVEVGK